MPYPSFNARMTNYLYSDGALEANYRNATRAGLIGTSGFSLANEISSHFISEGQGSPLEFNDQFNPIQGLLNGSKQFQEYRQKFEKDAAVYFRSKGSLDGFIGETSLGHLQFGSNDLALFTIMGQVQKVDATITAIQLNNDKTVSLNVQYRLSDTYGAGIRDGQRSFVPGLVSMFVLQHYRNTENKTKYRPFIISAKLLGFGKY